MRIDELIDALIPGENYIIRDDPHCPLYIQRHSVDLGNDILKIDNPNYIYVYSQIDNMLGGLDSINEKYRHDDKWELVDAIRRWEPHDE